MASPTHSRAFGILTAAAAAAAFAAAPAGAEKTPPPKPGTVIKGLKSCATSPPTCYITMRTATPGRGEPASRSKAGGDAATGANGRIVYGCWRRDGTITVTTGNHPGACPKGSHLIKIVLKD